MCHLARTQQPKTTFDSVSAFSRLGAQGGSLFPGPIFARCALDRYSSVTDFAKQHTTHTLYATFSYARFTTPPMYILCRLLPIKVVFVPTGLPGHRSVLSSLLSSSPLSRGSSPESSSYLAYFFTYYVFACPFFIGSLHRCSQATHHLDARTQRLFIIIELLVLICYLFLIKFKLILLIGLFFFIHPTI